MTTHLHRATQSNKKWGGIQREAQMGTSPRKHKNPKWISFQSGPFIFYFVFFFSKWFAMASPNWSKRRTGMPRDFHHLLFHSENKPKNNKKWLVFLWSCIPHPKLKEKVIPFTTPPRPKRDFYYYYYLLFTILLRDSSLSPFFLLPFYYEQTLYREQPFSALCPRQIRIKLPYTFTNCLHFILFFIPSPFFFSNS